MSFGLVSVFQLAYPKAELEDLGFSGLQVVPTTFQPLQGQPVRRVIATVCPLANHRLSHAQIKEPRTWVRSSGDRDDEI